MKYRVYFVSLILVVVVFLSALAIFTAEASAGEISTITMEWDGEFSSGTLTMKLTTSKWATFPRDFDDGLIIYESDTGWHVLRNMWREVGPNEYVWTQAIPVSLRRFRIDANVLINWETVWPWEVTPDGLSIQKDYWPHITEVPPYVFPGVQFCVKGYNMNWLGGSGEVASNAVIWIVRPGDMYWKNYYEVDRWGYREVCLTLPDNFSPGTYDLYIMTKDRQSNIFTLNVVSEEPTPTPVPTSTPEPTQTPTPTVTPPPTPTLEMGEGIDKVNKGCIEGWLFIDNNGDGIHQHWKGETDGIIGVQAQLSQNDEPLKTRETVLGEYGAYWGWCNLLPGSYQVAIDLPDTWQFTSSSELTLTATAGQRSINNNFGIQPKPVESPASN